MGKEVFYPRDSVLVLEIQACIWYCNPRFGKRNSFETGRDDSSSCYSSQIKKFPANICFCSNSYGMNISHSWKF